MRTENDISTRTTQSRTNKRKGVYGCCLDLFASRYNSEIAELRHASPTVVGRFIFFRDSVRFLTQTRVLGFTTTTTEETGQTPIPKNGKSPKIYRNLKKKNGDFN